MTESIAELRIARQRVDASAERKRLARLTVDRAASHLADAHERGDMVEIANWKLRHTSALNELRRVSTVSTH